MKSDPASEMLFTMAEKDYTTIRKMAVDEEFADEVFGFHAQQATEKAAKAMLASRGISFFIKIPPIFIFNDLNELPAAVVGFVC